MRQETINRNIEAWSWESGQVGLDVKVDCIELDLEFTRDEALKLAEFILESVGDEATRAAYRLAQVAGEEAK